MTGHASTSRAAMEYGFIPHANCPWLDASCFRLSQCLGGCKPRKTPTEQRFEDIERRLRALEAARDG